MITALILRWVKMNTATEYALVRVWQNLTGHHPTHYDSESKEVTPSCIWTISLYKVSQIFTVIYQVTHPGQPSPAVILIWAFVPPPPHIL
jgi:hypothetical protein